MYNSTLSTAQVIAYLPLTEAEMAHVERTAREIAPLLRPWDWPIARRNRAALSRAAH